ncbi:MAG: FecR domain-containing protein [Chitinophagaceae bacterium]
MKDFSLFEIADFVMDEDFIRWVNNKSKADDDYWENWLTRNPHKLLIIAEARRIIESIGTGQPFIQPAGIDLEVEKVLQAINRGSELPEENLTYKPYGVGRFAAAVLLIMALLGASVWIFTSDKKPPKKFAYASITASRPLIEHVNTTLNTITISLPDGSTVKLASNSRISYDRKFDSLHTRDIYLSGQAFFTVRKNPHRPFRVFANEVVAKVLGTSFTVRSFEKDTIIQVTVSSGKVSVYSQAKTTVKESASASKPGGIILTPNQQLVYEKSSQEFQKILMENPVMIKAVMVNNVIPYEDAPINKVFDVLGTDYGINIVYDSELLKNCTVSADLSNETFYHKLDLICRAIGASYEVIDGQVVIQANGCH